MERVKIKILWWLIFWFISDNLDKKLSDFNIRNGVRLKCDDFLQVYNLNVNIVQVYVYLYISEWMNEQSKVLRSAVGMTQDLRSDLWWTIPLRILLGQFLGLYSALSRWTATFCVI